MAVDSFSAASVGEWLQAAEVGMAVSTSVDSDKALGARLK
jgi:hypothetical protein